MTIQQNKFGGVYPPERRQGTGLILSPTESPKGGLRRTEEVTPRG